MRVAVSSLGKAEYEDILDNILEKMDTSKDWYSFFPKIVGYNYLYPTGYEDIEVYPQYYRGPDHALAAVMVKHPDLHDKIIGVVEKVTHLNKTQGAFYTKHFEHAGACFAVEIALIHPEFIYLYADFLASNDIYYDVNQSYDIYKIIRKWGLIPETYYLILTRWFIQGDFPRRDLDYFTYNGFSLNDKLHDDFEVEKFIGSLALFLTKSEYPHDELQGKYAELFNELVDEYIFPKEKKKTDYLKTHYLGFVEKLSNGISIIPENNIPENNINYENYEEIAVLGPEIINNNNNLTQPTWSWDDEDIPEI